MSEPIKNLFGEIDLSPIKITGRKDMPKGYARRPGSGPSGETCKTCIHHRATGSNKKTFYKCFLLAFRWTHGPGTDIRLKSSACELWKGRQVVGNAM